MIVKIKRSRYKPLYKKFIYLKTNVQNRRRLNLLKFKKKKWEKLIGYLKRLQTRRKKKFRMYDINRYYLPKFYNSFKKKYDYRERTKKKLKLFYGSMSKKVLKKYINQITTKKAKLLKSSINLNSLFIGLLEKRLDTILYRSQFVLSFRAGRQLISHRHVKINDKLVTDNSYIVKTGDLIQVSDKVQKLVEWNIRNSHIWPLPPKYLQINYKTLEILFLDTFGTQNFSIYFPFWVDIGTLLRYYR